MLQTRHHSKGIGARLARLVLLLVAVLTLPAWGGIPVGSLSPSITISSPEADDFFDIDIAHVSGTASAPTNQWSQGSKQQFDQGTHTGTYATTAGEVIVHPAPGAWTRQNGTQPVLDVGAAASFDDEGVAWPSTVVEGLTTMMYYSGYDGVQFQIGLANSTDGITFARQNGGAPLIPFGPNGDFDSFHAKEPWVVKDGATWRMWYTGWDGLKERIGYATSADGLSWAKQGMVLDVGANGAFDDSGVGSASVVKDGGTWVMLFSGFDGVSWRIARATSPDGSTWTKQGVVLNLGEPNGFSGTAVRAGRILAEGTRSMVFYTGVSGAGKAVGYAIGVPDGPFEHLTGTTASFSGTASSWDEEGVWAGTIERDATSYTMYYTGYDATTTRIGLATAPVTGGSGTLLSAEIDFGGPVDFGTIDWVAATPGGTTLTVDVRHRGGTGTWTTFSGVSKGGSTPEATSRYLQYRLTLTTSDPSLSPSLTNISLTYVAPLTTVEVTSDFSLWRLASGTSAWSIDLPLPEGEVTIGARATDSTGDVSPIPTVDISVDSKPPTGNVTIDLPGNFSTSRTVPLSFNATDLSGVESVQLGLTPNLQNESWLPYAASMPYTFPVGDGPETIYARFRDPYGHVGIVSSDSITVDTSPPTLNVTVEGTPSTDGLLTYVTARRVILHLLLDDTLGVDAMRISTNADFSGAIWEEPVETRSLILPDKEGKVRLYVEARDISGLSVQTTLDIVLDTVPPKASLLINSGALTALSRFVTLAVEAEDSNGIEGIRLSNASDYSDGSWFVPTTNVLEWQLNVDEGVTQLYLQVKDHAGLLANDSAIVDIVTIPPEGTVVIEQGANYTNRHNLRVAFAVPEDISVDQMRVGLQPDLSDGTFDLFADDLEVELPANRSDGPVTVYVQFKDFFGGLTNIFSDDITIDTTAPKLVVSAPRNSTVWDQAKLPIKGTATDERSGIALVEVSLDGGRYVKAAGTADWAYTPSVDPSKNHNITVRVTDGAGNTATANVIIFKPKHDKETPMIEPVGLVAAIVVALALTSLRHKALKGRRE